MYISKMHLENFRNFTLIDIPFGNFTFLLGKNDVGKTNIFDAFNIILHNNKTNFFGKRLSIYDINKECINNFLCLIKNYFSNIKEDLEWKEKISAEFPHVIIEISFEIDNNHFYEIGLLKDWTNGDEKSRHFSIKYEFKVYKIDEMLASIKNYCDKFQIEQIDKILDYKLPIDFFDYDIMSTNNNKKIDYQKYKNFVANIVYANRDFFSSDENLASTSVISKIISTSMSDDERLNAENAYQSFFKEIEKYDSFKSVFDYLKNKKIKNLNEFIDELKLVPNSKKYQNVLNNVSISYGGEMLFQKGLGTRNLIFILTLFSHFNRKSGQSKYNLLAIEEPEAHLSVENYRLVMDFLNKSITDEIITKEKTKPILTQMIISTHSNYIVNKIGLNNVTILNSDKSATKLEDLDCSLTKYLSKRPNFDIFKLLFSKNVILVEGITEELYIQTILNSIVDKIFNIDVISIGQKGYKTFMDIWLQLHKNDNDFKLAVIRDYDNQENAKKEHEKYQTENSNIKVVTTKKRTFENDFIAQGSNLKKLNQFLKVELSDELMFNYLTSDKAESIYEVCTALTENKIELEIPEHIDSALKFFEL